MSTLAVDLFRARLATMGKPAVARKLDVNAKDRHGRQLDVYIDDFPIDRALVHRTRAREVTTAGGGREVSAHTILTDVKYRDRLTVGHQIAIAGDAYSINTIDNAGELDVLLSIVATKIGM